MVCTIYPDRITVRQAKRVNILDEYEKKLEREVGFVNKNSLKNLRIQKTSFGLSKNTVRKIKDTFNLLYNIVEPRTIKIDNKRSIYNYRLAFVTLTLPSKQVHTDIEIKRVALNNFLNVMREKFGLKNYIWVAELQKNDNIHFHIVWDLYINYHAVRYYWNRSLELLGYVSEYQKKFCNMSLSEYATVRGQSIEKVSKAFAKSVRENWSNPPTEQVVSISSQNSLAYYLSKYIAKNDQKEQNENSERLKSFGRSWGRSQSLSKIKFFTKWNWDSIKINLKKFDRWQDYINVKHFDYCIVYYFKLWKTPSNFLKWIRKFMLLEANQTKFKMSGL